MQAMQRNSPFGLMIKPVEPVARNGDRERDRCECLGVEKPRLRRIVERPRDWSDTSLAAEKCDQLTTLKCSNLPNESNRFGEPPGLGGDRELRRVSLILSKSRSLMRRCQKRYYGVGIIQ